MVHLLFVFVYACGWHGWSVAHALAGCAGCDAHEEAGLLLGLADPLLLSDAAVGLVKDFILI